MEELLISIRLATDMPERKREALALAVEEAATDYLDTRSYKYKVSGAATVQEIGEYLDDELGAARVSDPETAKRAAKVNYPRRKSNTHVILMLYLERGDEGLTASELEEMTAIEYRTLTPRIGYLARHGYIVATNRKRMGNRNQPQEVKVITDFGLNQIEKHEGVKVR